MTYRSGASLAFGLLILIVAAACSDTSNPTGAVFRVGNVLFPTQPTAGGERIVMDALYVGRLTNVDGCLRLEDETSYELIWPPGYDLRVAGDRIEVLDAAGRVTVRVGERIRVSGGEVHALDGLPLIDEPARETLSAQCPGPYWIVGTEVQPL